MKNELNLDVPLQLVTDTIIDIVTDGTVSVGTVIKCDWFKSKSKKTITKVIDSHKPRGKYTNDKMMWYQIEISYTPL